MDHAGAFYTGCCDTRVTAFTGESADRDADAVLCPEAPVFPACLFAHCLCGYDAADGSEFVVNGNYVGVVGPSHLQYDGHAGYDYEANAGAPLVATRAGTLCKAIADPVNGTLGAPTAWEGFHTFYVDHGVVAGAGWSSWYLHAGDLAGLALDGSSLAALAPGACAPVAAGQLVATAGNTGTGIPHLHFEVRRYLPLDGPEAASAKIVDPYGWRGAAADPWSDPSANPQATTQGPALWHGCGNGRVECGEACDDGNRVSGDCCSASCGAEAAGTWCGGFREPLRRRALRRRRQLRRHRDATDRLSCADRDGRRARQRPCRRCARDAAPAMDVDTRRGDHGGGLRGPDRDRGLSPLCVLGDAGARAALWRGVARGGSLSGRRRPTLLDRQRITAGQPRPTLPRSRGHPRRYRAGRAATGGGRQGQDHPEGARRHT